GRRYSRSPPIGCAAAMRSSMRCAASSDPRGTIVYLHGIADNRTSASGVIERFTARRFDVVAYDSRAHGESEGSACTYGCFEKHDLRRVVDTVRPGPVILIGTSLGAAVALQEAALDPRVTAVVAAEAFSAGQIKAPVLLIHGADDVDTPPDHSRRILAALE